MRSDEISLTWNHGDRSERLRLGWENGGITADGRLEAVQGWQWVVRMSLSWEFRQFLLFRDLAEADLWLGRDERGRWGEVNGARRPELDGCTDIELIGSAFELTPVLRRAHGLPVGEAVEVRVALVDPDTLGVMSVVERLSRLGPDRWRIEGPSGEREVSVDEQGLLVSSSTGVQRVAV